VLPADRRQVGKQFVGHEFALPHRIERPVEIRGVPQRDGGGDQVSLVGKGRSYRLIGRELGLSKNTVADIVKRARVAAGQP
jgi:hypothetical protein